MLGDEMFKAVRPSVFKLTEGQRGAMVDDLLRLMVMQKKLYRRCPIRDCRRLRACAAAGVPCACSGSMPPISCKDAKRFKRDLGRDPLRGRR